MAEPARPAAIWFGARAPRTFGMVLRPLASDGEGVVLCNTLGFEGLIAHRPFRHLADRLAVMGRTVVRIDYEGTGDAPGDATGPAQVRRCLDSIHDAVSYLREVEGCTRVSLVGVRAGALLAGCYALDHPGLANVVLWTPCDQGAQYVRELRALSRLAAAARPPQGPQPTGDRQPLEVVGFEFSPEMLADLGNLDLCAAIDRPLAERVLVLDRDDVPESAALLEALRATAADVEHRRVGGWAEFQVADETESVMPEEALDQIVSWFSTTATPAGLRPGEPLGPPARSLGSGPVVAHRLDGPPPERPVWIDQRLFAIVTEPSPTAVPRQAAVIMSNTGSVNHTGPGRLHVQLARRWADLGFTVVRVDLGGCGSSPAPPRGQENRPYDPERTAELGRVVEWVTAHTDATAVALFGICSGAFHSFHATLRGAEATCLLLVNTAIFYLGTDETLSTSASKAVTAAQNVRRLRFVRTRIRGALRSPGQLVAYLRRAGRGYWCLAAAWLRTTLSRMGLPVVEPSNIAVDLDRLAARGVSVHAIFAEEEPGALFLRTFGGLTLARLQASGAVTVTNVPGGDHVFSPVVARRAMADAVTDRLLAWCPVPAVHAGLAEAT